MGIEFGILREGSTITLIGEHRICLDEELFTEMLPLFQRIETRTGQEFDMYGGAKFEADALQIFIEELEVENNSENELSPGARAFLGELQQVARIAQKSNRSISYFGL